MLASSKHPSYKCQTSNTCTQGHFRGVSKRMPPRESESSLRKAVSVKCAPLPSGPIHKSSRQYRTVAGLYGQMRLMT